jgi:hypothetical protein
MTWQAKAIAWLIFAAALFGAGFGLGTRLKQAEWDADVLARESTARKVEASWAAQIAQARSTRDDEIDRINGRLADALERLRKRPERMPEASRATCQGATGAELSGPDGGFLEREAARADDLRAALAECYRWAVVVTNGGASVEQGAHYPGKE